MHDWILEEMDRIRDPYRTFHWSKRSWRDVGNMFYMKQPFAFSNLPDGFPFSTNVSTPTEAIPTKAMIHLLN